MHWIGLDAEESDRYLAQYAGHLANAVQAFRKS
jgi:hypothetical protein